MRRSVTIRYTSILLGSFRLVRGLFPLEKKPGVLSLLAGKPSGSMFPFTSVTFGTRDPSDPTREYKLDVAPDLLNQGLQYGGTDGIPPAVEWLTMLQEKEHKRRRDEGWRVSVTAGSQDAIYKVNCTRRVHQPGQEY